MSPRAGSPAFPIATSDRGLSSLALQSDYLITSPLMARRISATDASRKFSDLLDAVEHRNEEFVVERRGRAIAELTPARGRMARGATWGDVLRLFDEGVRPDPQFARDMARVRRSPPRMPKDPWARS